MAKLELISEEDNNPGYSYYEAPQGSTWTNYKVFRITTESGEEVFFKIGQIHNSYGSPEGVTGPTLVVPKEVTVVTWQ